MFFPWCAITMLGFESSSVIQKRLVKISLGGTASFDEMRLMIAEKIDAAFATTTALMLGGSVSGTVKQYRTLVAANEARLSAV